MVRAMARALDFEKWLAIAPRRAPFAVAFQGKFLSHSWWLPWRTEWAWIAQMLLLSNKKLKPNPYVYSVVMENVSFSQPNEHEHI